MALEKVYASPETALADVFQGALILVSGVAGCGLPSRLLQGLANKSVGGLTLIYSHAAPTDPKAGDIGFGSGIEQLVSNRQVVKIISPLPFLPGGGGAIEERWRSGDLEIEVTPLGILAERLRAGGAGLGGVFLPTGVGTRFETGKEKRAFPRGEALLELPLKADFALIKVETADTLGSVVYRGTGRNWAPVMAMAASVTIAEADAIVEPGGLDPEAVITPGIFVNRLVAAA